MSLLDADYLEAADGVGDLWKKIEGAHILLTGGTGFFGLWLLHSYLFAVERRCMNAHLTVLSRNPTAFLDKNPALKGRKHLSFIQGDVRDFQSPKGSFSHVIHAAVDVSPALSGQNIETYDVLYRGSKRVLDFCREKNVQSILLISSGAVYGRQEGFVKESVVSSELSVVPSSLYAEGKRISEWMFLNSDIEAKVKVARCFAFIGPHLSLDAPFAVSYFFRQAINNEPIVLQSDGAGLRSYMYGSDLAVWLWSLLLSESTEKIFNVGSDKAVSVLEMAQRIVSASGKNIQIISGKTFASDVYVPDIEKAQKQLAFSLRVSLDQAIERTWNFWRGTHGG